MNTMKMSLDRRSILWIVGILVATAAFCGMIVRPQFGRLVSLNAMIDREHTEITSGRNSPQSIAQLQQEVEELSRLASRFDEQIPREADLGKLVQTLAAFAEAHQLRPDSIKPGAAVTYSDVTGLPIAIRVRGPFQAIFELIKSIEQSPRLTQMERCAVIADNDGKAVTAELDFRVFFRAS